MAKCEYCGKDVAFGIKVSHSHRRSNRTWKPNVKRVKAIVNGSPKRVYACTRCLRSGKVTRAIWFQDFIKLAFPITEKPFFFFYTNLQKMYLYTIMSKKEELVMIWPGKSKRLPRVLPLFVFVKKKAIALRNEYMSYCDGKSSEWIFNEIIKNAR